jgi:hypothetical protein
MGTREVCDIKGLQKRKVKLVIEEAEMTMN